MPTTSWVKNAKRSLLWLFWAENCLIVGFMEKFLGAPIHMLVSLEECWDSLSPSRADVRRYLCVWWRVRGLGFWSEWFAGQMTGLARLGVRLSPKFSHDWLQTMGVAVTLFWDVRTRWCLSLTHLSYFNMKTQPPPAVTLPLSVTAVHWAW